MADRPPRILICVVAYEAESTIADVISRIPATIRESARFSILVSDDASRDDTTAVAQSALETHARSYALLRLASNQGYGGNQKICYRYALEHGFDWVILLHGDGQYAPELLPEFVRRIDEQSPDVIIGSRMIDWRLARQGGMPWFKIVANRLLTRLQNALSGSTLSEFHSGYRAYAAQFLKKAPFELNHDGFHFDTEILLQAFHCSARISEFSIPAHYGDEICRVPLIRYGLDVLAACLRFRLQRIGLLTSLKFPHSAESQYRSKTQDPNSSHAQAIRLLEDWSDLAGLRVLDIGCGPGWVAHQLGVHGARVTGVDAQAAPPEHFERFLQIDLERDEWPLDISKFDVVLMLDIIEHLAEPERFLLALRHAMTGTHTPLVMVSVPNIGFVLARLNLLFGRFNYADRGILDITHKRFFTASSLKNCLQETGFVVDRMSGIGVPMRSLGGGPLFRLMGGLSALLARAWPRLFAFQLLITAHPKPTARQHIANSLVTDDSEARH